MNLVCLEYIVAQNEKNSGVVLLSEFTGASSTLSHAQLINPNNIYDTAKSIKSALQQNTSTRIKNHKVMFNYLKEYTATVWAKSFINHLELNISEQHGYKIDLSHVSNLKKLATGVKNRKKCFLLDFDGTLAPIQNDPQSVNLPSEIKKTLLKLISDKDNEIVIVTGRDKKFISSRLKGLDVYIACEHGASFYDYKKKKWRSLSASKRVPWMKDVKTIFNQYATRTPNSFIEVKDYAICWHYRKSPQDFAEFQARKLIIDLESVLSHEPVNVSKGKKIVEVKSLEANKGYFTEWFISRYIDKSTDIIAFGDDRTDEDMFKFLENKGHTIKVGEARATDAKYFILDQGRVNSILKEFTK